MPCLPEIQAQPHPRLSADTTFRMGRRAMMTVSKAAHVSELLPHYGTIGGVVRVTLRGVRLGENLQDIIGVECGSCAWTVRQWNSPTEVICDAQFDPDMPVPIGEGDVCYDFDVRVSTLSGSGAGTSALKFRWCPEGRNRTRCDQMSPFGVWLSLRRLVCRFSAGGRWHCRGTADVAEQASTRAAGHTSAETQGNGLDCHEREPNGSVVNCRPERRAAAYEGPPPQMDRCRALAGPACGRGRGCSSELAT
jgi:hypothetical protein